ncbi:MAG: nicotinate (nicotinamide) nucleotide adenylyltransferase [Mariprofundales bacterium]
MNARRIAMYGGSFDPPHIGHESLARLAVERFALGQLLVIPAQQPVHRSLSGCVDAATKLAWLREIWRDEPRISVVDWESAAPMPTIATLRYFHKVYPQEMPLLLMGSDAAAGIGDWIGYPQHRRLCNLAVFDRIGVATAMPAGWDPMSVAEWKGCANARSGGVIFVDSMLPAISASRVRQTLKEGGDIADLVPAAIQNGVRQRYVNRE